MPHLLPCYIPQPARAGTLVALVLATACGDDGPSSLPDPAATASLEIVASDVLGVVGETPDIPPSVRVVSPDGDPLAGVEVFWIPQEASGLAATSTFSSADGIASPVWALGKIAGPQSIVARLLNGTEASLSVNVRHGRVVSVEGPAELAFDLGLSTPAPIVLLDTFRNAAALSLASWSTESTDIATVASLPRPPP